MNTRVVHATVFVLALAAFGSGISQRIIDPLLPQLAVEFGVSLGSAAWTITSFTIGYAACQLLFGPIGDRYGKYRVIVWGCAASAAAAAVCALAVTLPQLMIARAISGGMTAAIYPLAMAWIGDAIPYAERQPVLARLLIGVILGAAAAQLLGGLSADLLGRRVPFLLIALLFGVSAVALWRMSRSLPATALAGSETNDHAIHRMWREFVHVVHEPHARLVLFTVMCEGAAVFGAFAFFATHLHLELDITLTLAGTVVMLFGLGGFLFALGSRTLIARLGEAGMVRLGAACMAVSLACIAFVPHITVAAIACLVMGFGFYMHHNTLQTHATQMAPQRRGAAVAAFALCYFIGQSLGVAVAGEFVSHSGIGLVFLACAVAIALLAAYFVRGMRRA